MGYSDPLSLVLAGDARASMNYGMIATGNHQYSNSLRGAPPLISKGSLCPHPSRLRRATFPGGEGLENGL